MIGSWLKPGISCIGSFLITLGSPIIFILLTSYSLNNDPLIIGSISFCPSVISAGLRTIGCAWDKVCVVEENAFPLIGADKNVLGSFVGWTFWKNCVSILAEVFCIYCVVS